MSSNAPANNAHSENNTFAASPGMREPLSASHTQHPVQSQLQPQPQHHQRKGTPKGIIVALIAALMVIVVLLAYIITSRTPSTDSEAQNSPNTSAPAQGSTSAQPSNPEQNSAQVFTDPQQIETLKSLQRRDANDPLAEGAVDAPVVMQEFSDFSCPICAQWATDVYPQLHNYIEDGTLRIEMNPWVIFPDYGSDIAARGLFAAGMQGKAAEFYSLAAPRSVGQHAQWDEATVLDLASKASVADLERFTQDMASAQAEQALNDAQNLALGIGFGGTPAFIINNRVIAGSDSIEVFRATIDAAAADVEAGAF